MSRHSRGRYLQARASLRVAAAVLEARSSQVAILVLSRRRIRRVRLSSPARACIRRRSPSNKPSFEGSLSPSKSVTPSSGPSAVPSAGPPVCGDGVVDPGETCDDGNTLPCDGCSATCQIETSAGTCDQVVILQNRDKRYVTLDGSDALTWAGASQDISSAEVFIREWSSCDAFTLKSTTTGNFAEPQGGLLAATGTNGTVFSPEVCGTDPADYSALRADLDGDGDAFNDAFNYWKSDPTLSLTGGCPPADTVSWEKFQIVVTSAIASCDVSCSDGIQNGVETGIDCGGAL